MKQEKVGMTMNNGITTVADMGYIVYTYAFNPDVWYFDLAYQKYSVVGGCVLADENQFSYRKEKNVHYKENRKAHKDDPTHIIARKFWKEQREEGKANGLHIISMYGAEGDDIIAILAFNYGLDIVGIDKDYYQLPNVKQVNTLGVEQGIKVERLPKTLQGVHWDNTTWLLHLAINGDVSDNVPRLTEKGKKGLQVEASVLTDSEPFKAAYDLWGNDFLNNLYEVILPYPMLMNTYITPYQVYQMCRDGLWYDYVSSYTPRIELPDVWEMYGK